jgi:hypothetical protein
LRIGLRECVGVVGNRLVGRALGFGEGRRRDLRYWLVQWVVGRRSVGSVGRMVIARRGVEVVGERL